MHRIVRICATAMAVAALSAPAFAQSQAPAAGQGQAQGQVQRQDPSVPAAGGDALVAAQSPDQQTAEQLIGMTVINNEGEAIGEIQDLVIDQGSIAGAVISVGGFLGIGAKDVGVAWSAVELEKVEGRNVALVRLTKADLEAAPAFKPYRPAPPAVGTGGALRQPVQPKTN